jgi:4-hydroxybutyrate CoA-transferase
MTDADGRQPGRRPGAEMSPEEAVALLRSDDVVVVGHVEPLTLLEEICRQGERLAGLTLYVWPLSQDSPYMSGDARERFRIRTLSPSLFRRYPGAERYVQYAPAHVSTLSRRWPRELGASVILLHLAAPDPDGRLSFGICADYSWSFQPDATRLVLAEANELMPCPRGEAQIPRSGIDAFVRSKRSIRYFVHDGSPSPEDRAIAEHVVELVPDGATLEVGVGSGGRAIWERLASKSDLGIHSGSLGAEALDLIESGAVTNRHHSRSPKSVAAMVTGTEETLWRAAECPNLHIVPSAFTHDVREISRIDRFVAINSCLEIDLFGQIYSERANGRWLGSIGGQADFMRGARYSHGGLSIIALRAASVDGRQSRIRGRAPSGSLVTVSHADVDFVVTEHGTADLRTRTLEERAQRLLSIAAPQHRDRLVEELEADRAAARLGAIHGRANNDSTVNTAEAKDGVI